MPLFKWLKSLVKHLFSCDPKRTRLNDSFMENLCYLNGEFLPLSEAKVSALDRGFLFGDGVYEALRIYDGKLFRADEHFQRLARSLDGLRIAADPREARSAAEKLLERSGLREAMLYMQITRGAAKERRHFFPGQEVKPTVFMFITPYDDTFNASMRENGAKAVTFPDLRWSRVDLKTLNLLGNVLGAQAAKEAGVYESIFINKDGFVTEGSHTNVYAIIKGEVRTFPLSTSVLPGITRIVVTEAAKKEGISFSEKPVTKDELFSADEVFISATTPEIFPITEIDGKSIGGGMPGVLTKRLQVAFRREIESFLK